MQQNQTAVIFAAGFGKRLWPLTKYRPKPLMEIMGKPILWYVINSLQRFGYKNIIMNLHYLSDAILRFIDHLPSHIKINLIYESTIQGTGGFLKNIEDVLAGQETCLLHNADVLIDVDLQKLKYAHKSSKSEATLVLASPPNIDDYGKIGIDSDNRIRSFAGRVPYSGPKLHELMFCGVHMVSSDIYSHLPQRPNCIAKTAYPDCIANNQMIMGYKYSGYFCDIGTLSQLWLANMNILQRLISLSYLDPFAQLEQKGENIWVNKGVNIDATVDLIAPVAIFEQVTVGKNCKIGPNVIIGNNSSIGHDSKLAASVIMSGSHIKKYNNLNKSIVLGEQVVPV